MSETAISTDMDLKPCQFEGCCEPARPGWRYCDHHILVMYRRMLDEGYLEPWPDGEEPPLPQDLMVPAVAPDPKEVLAS
ncbi:MAG: hypothetical protein BIFFINMI_03807 [Phycisphaerae bacterium]|nr:hypothetical protein [Phycisphaerae bacterium]